MYILGINISHDTSSCLLKDGEILFYQEEERFSKIKHNIIEKGKRLSDIKYYQIPSIKKNTNYIDYIVFSSYKDKTGYDYTIINDILNQLSSNGVRWNHCLFNEDDHHLCHASAAAFSSGFEECGCLIIDGSGSFINDPNFREIESIYSFNYSKGFYAKFKHYSIRNENQQIFNFDIMNDCIFAYSSSIGCGDLFSRACNLLGLGDGRNAGKIMGLASYGKILSKYNDWFSLVDDISITNNDFICYILDDLKNSTFENQQNILKSLQEETKKHTIHLIEKTLEMCNTKNIVLSGGYFLNCVNNYHYLKAFPNVNFYVDPIAHDGGTAIGVAKYLWYNLTQDQTIRKLNSLYLGQQ